MCAPRRRPSPSPQVHFPASWSPFLTRPTGDNLLLPWRVCLLVLLAHLLLSVLHPCGSELSLSWTWSSSLQKDAINTPQEKVSPIFISTFECLVAPPQCLFSWPSQPLLCKDHLVGGILRRPVAWRRRRQAGVPCSKGSKLYPSKHKYRPHGVSSN